MTQLSTQMDVGEAIDDIVRKCDDIVSFWGNGTPGWAPQDVAQLLEKSRLDRQASLARMLRYWVDDFSDDESEGALILAWANLGALVEASMQWFLCVHAISYEADPVILDSGRQLEPEELFFGRMCRFFEDRVWTQEQTQNWRGWLNAVRKRRNAIHAYKDRPLGTLDDFATAIVAYRDFIWELDSQVPYPDVNCG